jgi:hypothetical protein
MDNPTVILTFNKETFLVNLDAPDLPLDFVMSILKDALRQCENLEKITIAQQVGTAARAAVVNQERTSRVLDRIKLQ